MTFVYMKGKGNAASSVSDVSGFLNISALPAGWDKYDVVMVEKAYLKVRPSQSAEIKLFNVLTARSGLKGMKYYSITDDNVKDLVLESGLVKSCSDRSHVADTVYSAAEPEHKSVFVIRDNRMGVICFNGRVLVQNGNFYETDISCGTVSRFGMRVFNDGGYVIKHCIIRDETGGGYFYCSVQVMKVESSIMKRLDLLGPENFGNRIRGETVHLFGLMGCDISPKIAAFR